MAIIKQITTPEIIDEVDQHLDTSLRPQRLADFIGQEDAKKTIELLIKAAQKRSEALDHILFYGPPGTGKTTLGKIIASEMGVEVRITSGPALERPGDIASILTNLPENGILFIDEIHRIPKLVEETLYPAMEEHVLDIIVGKGPSAQTIRLDLPHFTIIGATTRIGLLGAPIRDRFGAIIRLDYYDDEALTTIIQSSAKQLNVTISPEAALMIALRSRGTPRVANRLLKRIRDYVSVKDREAIIDTDVHATTKLLGIDADGLHKLDYAYLEALTLKFNGGPTGIETLAAAISEDIGSIEEVIEPFLIRRGLIQKTPRGRQITEAARLKVTP